MTDDRLLAVDEFLDAFNRADFEALRGVRAEDRVAYVTTDDGDQRTVNGADAYVASLRDMVTKAPTEYNLTFTQKPVFIDDERVLAMLEIHAERGGRSLHNYSAQLFRFTGNSVSEIRMTDAKPEESARFWE